MKFYKVLLIFIAFSLLFINSKFYYQTDGNPDKLNLECQLNYLENKMKDGGAEHMQTIFPEGYFFMNLLYGLSWVEYGNKIRDDDSVYNKAYAESKWAFNNLLSAKGKQVFESGLEPPYGAFYSGWTNYLRAKRLEVFNNKAEPSEISAFQESCKQLASAYDNGITPYLESYPFYSWPADNIPGIASLNIHDKLFDMQYQKVRSQWLKKARQRLDPETGLIPHSVKHNDGKPLEGARGSSQSLMNIILPDVDTLFAKEQYALYKKHFVSSFLGLPIVREYPKGKFGVGDIDSGPVIFGVGGAATVVGYGSLKKHDDADIATAMRKSIEAFGFPVNISGKKRYLFGSLIIGDAFLLWADLQNPVKVSSTINEDISGWRLKFHLACLGIFMVLCLPLLYAIVSRWIWK